MSMKDKRCTPYLDNILFNVNRKPRIILDMDDVIVEYIESVLEDYNNEKSTNYTINNCTTWTLSDILGKDVINYLNSKGRFNDLKIKNNADIYIKELIDSNRYDVFIVTACKPDAYIEKINWLNKYMPFFDKNRLIPATEKSAVWGDVIIDDKIDNVVEFTNTMPSSIGILYDMPHNVSCEKFKRVYSLKNLLYVLDNIFYEELEDLSSLKTEVI